jgi:hypothetical protein
MKHPETFWVKAMVHRPADDTEHFHFTKVIHTTKPLVTNLALMLSDGRIELDYTLSKIPTKSGFRARDHGYLFKIYPEGLSSLFPPAKEYDLLQ